MFSEKRAQLASLSALMVIITFVAAPDAVAAGGVRTAGTGTVRAEPVLLRIHDPGPELGAELERAGFDVVLNLAGRLELLADAAAQERLGRLGIGFEPLPVDLFPGARSTLREGNLDPEYHTFIEMLTELVTLEADYPEICKVYDIGDAESKNYTWGNYFNAYDIWALRISDHPTLDEPEPCVVFDARHHAREPLTTELVLAVAGFYCQNYGVVPWVTEAVDRTEIWIVPMVNPDGHQWVEDHDPWWRKTLYDYDADHWVDDDEGIDPNRNYDWHWAPTDWWSEIYGGPAPFSAPESAAIRDLSNQHRPCINGSYHSYGEVILYPFGYGVVAEPAVLEVANELGMLLGYDVAQSTTANGSSKDWVYGAIGGAAFTVETATEFIPSGPEMQAIVTSLLLGSTWLAPRAWGASVQGTVTDSLTGAPLAAAIHIPEIQENWGNGELLDMQTEAATGYYCRIRPQASETITLEVSAPGYQPKSVQATTGGYEATVVDVQLVPESAGIPALAVGAADAAMVWMGRNRPNPFNPHTTLPFHLAASGRVTIQIYDVAGRLLTTIIDQEIGAGGHVAHWDGTDEEGRPQASGAYLARMRAGGYEQTRRLVLLR